MKNTKSKLRAIICEAIDIHVHIGPEVIPRKYTAQELVTVESGNLSGCVLKNHFYVTSSLFTEKDTRILQLYGGIVLNNAVGGLNPDAIFAAASITNKPIIVWFPTINSKQFLENSKYELAPEWIRGQNIKLRLTKDVPPVVVTRENKLTDAAKRVIDAIADTGAVLATGHISWKESLLVVEYALSKNVKRMVITHPIYQRIDMPLKYQKELAKKGCFIEQSYSMYSIDKIPIKIIAKQIKTVGAISVVLSSDVGQKFSPSPSEALYEFATLLLQEGFSLDDIKTMMVNNPNKLLE